MLCASSDIIFLQETWLTDFDTQFLTIISDEFYTKGISSMDSSIHLLPVRPHVELGILLRKSLGEKCNIVDFDDTRLLGIEIAIKNNDDEIKLLVVNIGDDIMRYVKIIYPRENICLSVASKHVPSVLK
jgi:hypothetical protein